MPHDKNSKTKRVVITIPEWENDLLESLSNGNPKSEENKSNNMRHLYRYGFIYLKQQFNIQSREDFQKNMKVIRTHSDINFEETLKNFFNKIKSERGLEE